MDGCALAIVGSHRLSPDQLRKASEMVSAILDAHEPRLVISGGASGVDQLAEAQALARGIPTSIHEPKRKQWAGPGGFKERNTRIAKECECLVRIYSPDSKTYGSGWTADEADRRGKTVDRFALD